MRPVGTLRIAKWRPNSAMKMSCTACICEKERKESKKIWEGRQQGLAACKTAQPGSGAAFHYSAVQHNKRGLGQRRRSSTSDQRSVTPLPLPCLRAELVCHNRLGAGPRHVQHSGQQVRHCGQGRAWHGTGARWAGKMGGQGGGQAVAACRHIPTAPTAACSSPSSLEVNREAFFVCQPASQPASRPATHPPTRPPTHPPTCQLAVHAVCCQDEVIGRLESGVAGGVSPVEGGDAGGAHLGGRPGSVLDCGCGGRTAQGEGEQGSKGR